MSTQLKPIKGRKETEFGYKPTQINLTRFSGGENGVMVQLNLEPDVDRHGIIHSHVQLTQVRIRELIKELEECLDYNPKF